MEKLENLHKLKNWMVKYEKMKLESHSLEQEVNLQSILYEEVTAERKSLEDECKNLFFMISQIQSDIAQLDKIERDVKVELEEKRTRMKLIQSEVADLHECVNDARFKHGFDQIESVDKQEELKTIQVLDNRLKVALKRK